MTSKGNHGGRRPGAGAPKKITNLELEEFARLWHTFRSATSKMWDGFTPEEQDQIDRDHHDGVQTRKVRRWVEETDDRARMGDILGDNWRMLLQAEKGGVALERTAKKIREMIHTFGEDMNHGICESRGGKNHMDLGDAVTHRVENGAATDEQAAKRRQRRKDDWGFKDD